MEGRSQWATRRPAPALAPFVERYVGYRLVGLEPGVHRGLPSRHMTFIVSIGDEIDVIVQTDPCQAPGRYRAVVSGLQASPAMIAYGAVQEGVAIELKPLGCRALFRAPARAFWDTTLELGDVTGPLGDELWARLQIASGWTDRFAVCDHVLRRLLCDDRIDPALHRSWEMIVATAGTLPVDNLAARVGWTRQHFAHRFRDEFGLSPKLAGRIVRFDRARRMLEAPPSFVSLAQVAVACGYYDQAHMTRDFVRLAGCPPGRLVAQDLPSVQDTESERGPG